MKPLAAFARNPRRSILLRVAPVAAVLVLFTASAGASTSDLSVRFNTPAAGETLSGSVTWAASASAASRVDFLVDGSVKWREYAAPYVFGGDGAKLDTTALTNGPHTLALVAYAARGGRRTSASERVRVLNTPGVPPTATALPSIAGRPAVGSPLAVSTGTWSPAPSSYVLQWQQCDSNGSGCAAIVGATGSSYVPTPDLGGVTVRVTVTASNAYGSGSATSAATAVIAPLAAAPTPSPTPSPSPSPTPTPPAPTPAPNPSPSPAPAPTPPTPAPAGTLGSALPARLPQSSGSGGTFYVDGARGSDSNNGSAASPWKTINKALASVPLSGSIIDVAPGTYASSGGSYVIDFSRAGSTSDPITLRAQTPGTVIIGNANPGAWTLGGWIHGASGLRIEGLVFRVNATANANQGSDGLLIQNSDRIEVTACTINEVGSQGLMVRGGVNDGEVSDDVWFIDNVFRSSSSNVTAQVTGTGWSSDQYFGSKGSHWIYAGQYGASTNWDISNGARRVVIVNNVFTGSTAGRDIELGPQAQSSYVVNNTFYGNHSASVIGTSTDAVYAGGGVEIFTNSSSGQYQTSGTIVKNNLFVDLDGHAVYGSGPSESGNLVATNLAYNLRNGSGHQGRTAMDYEPLYDGTSVLFQLGTNLADSDPLFANAAGFDFHPRSGSPALGQADPAYAYPYDADGTARPASPALGALE